MSSPLRHPVELPLSRIVNRLREQDLLVAAPEVDPVITGVSDDSRRTAPGDLFCAWLGTSSDSHAFVRAAADVGAAAALVERPVADAELPQVVVRNGRRAAAAAAAAAFGDPAEELRLVGVTGTNGKTTTVWILGHILAGRFETVSIGTLGILDARGEQSLSAQPLTTPGPVELAELLRGLVEMGIEAVAMEVSSHALDQGRVHSVRFDSAVFTNISRDHLDYHRTLEEYTAAKRKLADLLRPRGIAAINADEPAWSEIRARPIPSLLFSMAQASEDVAADVRATDLELGSTGSRFRLVAPGGAAEVELPLLGGFNVQNALAAATAAIALGVPVAEVAERLGGVAQVPGRLERISSHPCPVLRDYAHTPDALERVLSTLSALVPGRLIVVFGAGGDRDRGKRPLMGQVAERWADVSIVTSDNPRTEDPEAIVDEILAGMQRGSYMREVDRRQAIARALEIAGPEDLVLLAGKGHESYQVIGTERIDFDERVIVGDLLASGRGAVNGSGAAL